MPFFPCLSKKNKVDPKKLKDDTDHLQSKDGKICKKSNIECDVPEEEMTGLDSEDDEEEDRKSKYRTSWATRQMTEEFDLEDGDYSEIYDSNNPVKKPTIPIMINDSPVNDLNKLDTQSDSKTEKVTEDQKEYELKTLLDVMKVGAKKKPLGHCLGERDPSQNYEGVKWSTYKEIQQEINWFASGLLSIGLTLGQESRVAIYASNSPRWTVAQFAIYSNSMVLIPLYDRVHLRDYSFIMNETQAECVIVDTDSRTRDVISLLHQTPHVKIIITNDAAIEAAMLLEVNDNFGKIFSFQEILELGKRDLSLHEPFMSPKPEDLASICFTSGTTGVPKGVLLTHMNYVSSLKGVLKKLKSVDLSSETLLSFIPCAHSISLIGEMMMLASGGRVATYSGEIRHLINDLQVIKPTVLVTIPRFLDNISNRIIYSVKGNSLKTKLMVSALILKDGTIGGASTVKVGQRKKVLRSVVFRKQRSRILGGRVKVIINGSGPLSPNVMDFLSIALNCTILDSYGLIECAGFATMTDVTSGASSFGHSGSAIQGLEINIIEAKGCITSDKGIGEVIIRGDNVSQGYFDSHSRRHSGNNFIDGWFKTGDIAIWVESQGVKSLKIIERKENLVQLKSGHVIAPQRIQSIYNQSAFVSESFVDSDPDKLFLVAIVVPEVDYLNQWCVSNDLIMTTDQACRDILFRHHVLTDMLSTGQREGLHSYEQVRNIYLYPKSFTVETNLLTPNFETRRSYCKTFFHNLIQDLSKNIEHRRQSMNSLS